MSNKINHICGVQISTWGTHEHSGNGMAHYLDQKFFGGNVGHAAITITFPADERGRALLKQYCTDPPIPFEKHTIRVSPDTEEAVYVVNFSWWPTSSGPGFFIEKFENFDNLSERKAHPVEYESKWQDYLQPETRVHQGKFGKTKMTYDIESIVHKAGLTEQQIQLLDLQVEKQTLEAKIEALDILKEKLQKKSTLLQSLKIRKERINNKDKILPEQQHKISILEKLKTLKKKKENIYMHLSERDKALLSEIFPAWNKNDTTPSDISAAIKDIQQESKKLNQDSHEKLQKDLLVSSKLTETELILLNRLIKDWREKLSEEIVSPEELDTIINGTLAITKNIDLEQAKLDSRVSKIEKQIEKFKKKNKPVKPNMDDDDKEYRYYKHQREYNAWYEVYTSLAKYVDDRSASKIKPNASQSLPDYVKMELDEAFELIEKPWTGKQGYLANPNSITYDEAQALFKFVRSEMTKAREHMIDEMPGLARFDQRDFHHYLTRGHRPDVVAYLPLHSASLGADSYQEGMDVEGMLKEIQSITQTNSFSLESNNCSSTVSKILEAGATNPHLKHQFKNRALGAIANPQMVIKNAKDYLNTLKNPQDSWFKRLARFSPLEQLGGWCLSKLVLEENVPTKTKIAAGLTAIPIGLYTGIKMAIVKLANPLKTFKQLWHLASYANSKKSIQFKIMAALLYVPGMIITAPFAAIQYGVKSAITGIASALLAFFGAPKKVIQPPEYAELTDEQRKHYDENEMKFNEISRSILNNVKIIEVEAHTPEDAIRQFNEHVMEATQTYLENPDKDPKDRSYPLVMFSKETLALIESSINKLNNSQNQEEAQQGAKLEKDYLSTQERNQKFFKIISNIVKREFKDWEKTRKIKDAPPIVKELEPEQILQRQRSSMPAFNRYGDESPPQNANLDAEISPVKNKPHNP
jgi:hypothetical protein